MSATVANETVWVAFISAGAGLGGAFIVALVAVWIEWRRQKQQKHGISSAIRMDLIRWIEAYFAMTEEGRQIAHARQGLNWLALAPTATVHFPPILSVLLFHLYSARETTEAVYIEMTEGIEGTMPGVDARVFEARFALRQWALMAAAVIRQWDRYTERKLWRRVCARWRWEDQLDRKSVAAEEQSLQRIREEVRQRLYQDYDYLVGENGELLPENHTPGAYARMHEEMNSKAVRR